MLAPHLTIWPGPKRFRRSTLDIYQFQVYTGMKQHSQKHGNHYRDKGWHFRWLGTFMRQVLRETRMRKLRIGNQKRVDVVVLLDRPFTDILSRPTTVLDFWTDNSTVEILIIGPLNLIEIVNLHKAYVKGSCNSKWVNWISVSVTTKNRDNCSERFYHDRMGRYGGMKWTRRNSRE